MNSTETKSTRAYTSPTVTVIEVKVENGFGSSNEGGGNQLPSWEII